jgi:PBP1b-binding outer membrane lipoprotein LpoB
MRHMIKMALLAGTALAAAGCNRQAPVNNTSTNEIGQTENVMAPDPDASAVESVNSTPEPTPPAADNGAADDPGAANPGGDTGGNSLDVETNTPGI